MANTGNRFKPEAIREVAFGSVTASYVQMGGVFQGPLRTVRICNDTDADLYYSIDGVTDNFKLKSNSFLLLDCKTNDGFFDTGQSISVKGIGGGLPTSGSTWVEAIFA